MEYQWKLKSLRRTGDGVIVQTHWELTGTDEDGLSGTFYGATPFKLEEVNPDNFIPFEKLTESDILSWIQSVVVGYYREMVDRMINDQIEKQKYKIEEVQEEAFPWAATNNEVNEDGTE